MKPMIKNKDPRFDELTSRQQRAELNALLLERFGAPPGTEIAFSSLRIEPKGGFHLASLRAEWGDAALDFTVRILNKTGELVFTPDRMVCRSDDGIDAAQLQEQGRRSA